MPAAKPLRVLHKEGTYRSDRHADREDAPKPDGKPKRPRGLKGEAKKLWDEVVVYEWVGKSDATQLRNLCETWGLLRASMVEAQSDPTNKDKRIAVVSYLDTFSKLARQFGLSPTTRESIQMAGTRPDDALDEMIKAREKFLG